MKVVLASRSPQRKTLLKALGVEFAVRSPRIEEQRTGDPSEVVAANARAKAEAVRAKLTDEALVIAGDTEVVIEGSPLGQPADAGEARSVLGLLSGREHLVIGAVTLLGPGVHAQGEPRAGEPVRREGVERTRVRFRELSSTLLDAYVASGEWRGRAGGYAVQGLGSALVEEVRGDLSNVIGLPVPLLLRLAPELAVSRA